MKTSLLISTYNWPEALELVLKSAENQSVLPDEILLADDGSREETTRLIETFKKGSSIPVVHVWHEDDGFKRSEILNKTIAKATGDYIIQTDGDCILHVDFIKDHSTHARPGQYLYGSRVNIQEGYLPTLFSNKQIEFNPFSKGIKKRTRALRIPFFSRFYGPGNELSKKLRGCNVSYWKSDFISVNGYNEGMTGWGREDSELMVRMMNKGVLGRRLRYSGIVFHIWHKTSSMHNVAKNDAIQRQAVAEKRTWCERGIAQYL
ncbi:MAG: glycosyl transferase [Flavobacteriaceae bacterium]|nr:glycosyl transferase [Flavobacteriaceae bacterium]